MKSLGIVRKIDDLGRLVIPKEFRNLNGWDQGEAIEFFADGNKLVLRSFLGEREKSEAIEIIEEIITDSENEYITNQLAIVISYLKGENKQ